MNKKHYPVSAIILLAVGMLCTTITYSQEPANSAAGAHIMLTPDEINWGECPPFLPQGAKCAVIEGDPTVPNALFAIRAKMPDNYRIPPHFHSSDEHLVVISGVFNLGMGDKLDLSAGRAMTVGSFMVMPKGMHHFAWTTGETILQVYAMGPLDFIYINPKEDPRNQ